MCLGTAFLGAEDRYLRRVLLVAQCSRILGRLVGAVVLVQDVWLVVYAKEDVL